MTRLDRLALALAISPGTPLAGPVSRLGREFPIWTCTTPDVPPGDGSVLLARRLPGLQARREKALGRARDVASECAAHGLFWTVPGDSIYPAGLCHLPTPPLALFFRGSPAALRLPAVAIVGTRRPTPNGNRLARHLGAVIASAGHAVVSGGASGIDSAAHAGAVGAEGVTLVVLGSGLLRPYPSQNRPLFDSVCERGALISEYPPSIGPFKHHFPLRNRIIAALGQRLVVVQAPLASGTHSTVQVALDLGRDVYACPWHPDVAEGAGCRQLIDDGATPVYDGSELARADIPYRQFSGTSFAQAGFTPAEERILGLLATGPRTVTDLVAACGLPVETVLALLTGLELSGDVAGNSPSWYGLSLRRTDPQ